MAAAGGALVTEISAAGDVLAEMTAAVANMLEAALAAGLAPASAGQAPPGQREGRR